MQSGGELFAFMPNDINDDHYCSCGIPIIRCPFWRQVKGELMASLLEQGITFNQKLPAMDHKAILRPRMKTVHPDVHRQLELSAYYLAQSQRKVAKCDFVIDSSKILTRLLLFLGSELFDVRIVWLQKRLSNIIASNCKRGISITRAVYRWHKYYFLLNRILKTHGARERTYGVAFEDFVRDTQESITGLCAFLEIEFEAGMLALNEGRHHIFGGNTVRTDPDKNIDMNKAGCGNKKSYRDSLFDLLGINYFLMKQFGR